MPYKDPAKQKEYDAKRYEQNKEKKKEKRKDYYQTNKERDKEKFNESSIKCYEDQKQHAYDSIITCKIINDHKWDMWCNQIKRRASKYPYSITNDIIFKMMIKGCFYCGNIAIGIDRIDSKLDHIPENCVGCCKGCNISKGAADPSTFVRKAYYRVRGKYHDDDTDIWFVHKNKPSMYEYKKRAKKQGVPFELTKEYFDTLINEDCTYCKRSPTTWFGIDRVVPSKGYVPENVASCCFDCNVDKLDGDVESMSERNERIADRVDAGELIIDECDKVILHIGT